MEKSQRWKPGPGICEAPRPAAKPVNGAQPAGVSGCDSRLRQEPELSKCRRISDPTGRPFPSVWMQDSDSLIYEDVIAIGACRGALGQEKAMAGRPEG